MVRHGFYSRSVRLEDGRLIRDLLIARYRCRGKGKRRVDAVTFSLLPHEIVPYRRYCLAFMFRILVFWKLLRHTMEKTLDFIHALDKGTGLEVSEKTLADMLWLFDEAFERLSISRRLSSLVRDLCGQQAPERRFRFLERVQAYQGQSSREQGVLALERDYHLLQGGDALQAHFLFGTPSQFRFP